jgi:hypothetical protein
MLQIASRHWCIAETKTKAAHATASRSAVAKDNMGNEIKEIQTNSKGFAPRLKYTVLRRCPRQSISPLLTARAPLGSLSIHQLDHSSPHLHTLPSSFHLTSFTSPHPRSLQLISSYRLLLPHSPSRRTTCIITRQAPRPNFRHAIAFQPTRTLPLRDVVLNVGLVRVLPGVHILGS